LALTIAELLVDAQGRHATGDLAAARQLYRQVLALDASHAEALFGLGCVAESLGEFEEAGAFFSRVLQLHPQLYEAQNHMGIVQARLGHLEEAISSFERACRLRSESEESAANLRNARALRENHEGLAAAKLGNLDQAETHFRQALDLLPHFIGAQGNLGNVLARQGKLANAAQCYVAILQREPNRADAHHDLGTIHQLQCNFRLAVDHFRLALAIKPDYAEAQLNLGLSLARLGQTNEAFASLENALQCRPQAVATHHRALLAMQYLPEVNITRLAQSHRLFDERHAAALRAAWRSHTNQPDPERKLRLGFVSPDLFSHPVGYFLVGLLEHIDREQFDVTCYSDTSRADAITDRLRLASTTWREARTLDDEQLAEKIRDDQIDVLFDLAGHTPGNRLLAFARRPAPLAITWLGYVGTTGLSAIDYLLADRFQLSSEAEPQLVERVLRMPDGYLCYDPPPYAPAVSSLPAHERGHVTFGSLNNFVKITPPVIDAWAEILWRVPTARLVLRYRNLDAPEVRRDLLGRFAQREIDASRLELLGEASHADFLSEYGRIDIALDTFPYSGGLTTCEALWMGVPVVTWPGETFASRHSLTHLTNAGHTETIARNPEEYVRIAAELAADLPRLAALRGRLRQQMAASPLCDGQRFSRNFAGLVREAWRRWCDEQSPGS
jgi:protein O-GlcNAc transferase